MQSDKNIFFAFILNLIFSIGEFIGGAIIGSVAIASDALHDLGDAASIGISYLMERKSKKKADDTYTFGYGRYSVLGGLITYTVLVIGSIGVIISAISRFTNPIEINYTGMLVFAIIGVIINFIAAKITSHGHSTNQKAVNLHMLEDMMGWIAVLVGAVIMHFTHWTWIDPALSIGVAAAILYSALVNMIEITRILAERTPKEIDTVKLKQQITALKEIDAISAIHVWNINTHEIYVAMHITTQQPTAAKEKIRHILMQYNIRQSIIECHHSSDILPTFDIPHSTKCNCGHHHHHFPKIPFKKQ